MISPIPVHVFPAFNEPQPGNEKLRETHAQARSRFKRICGMPDLNDQKKYGLDFPRAFMAQKPNISPRIQPKQGVIQGSTARMADVYANS